MRDEIVVGADTRIMRGPTDQLKGVDARCGRRIARSGSQRMAGPAGRSELRGTLRLLYKRWKASSSSAACPQARACIDRSVLVSVVEL
jgi:hypothetical protein